MFPLPAVSAFQTNPARNAQPQFSAYPSTPELLVEVCVSAAQRRRLAGCPTLGVGAWGLRGRVTASANPRAGFEIRRLKVPHALGPTCAMIRSSSASLSYVTKPRGKKIRRLCAGNRGAHICGTSLPFWLRNLHGSVAWNWRATPQRLSCPVVQCPRGACSESYDRSSGASST